MDPRLREVLEALEDEEYVSDDDEDFFGQITRDGLEINKGEWVRQGEQQLFEENGDDFSIDDAGWESDDTIKGASLSPSAQYPDSLVLDNGVSLQQPPEDSQAPPPTDPTEGAWINEFRKFKSDSKDSNAVPKPASKPAQSTLESSALSSLATGRKKKRKGAKTSTTNYSMTSSALVRTQQQTLLDARFDKILEREDAEDDFDDDGLGDTASLASGLTSASKASAVSRYSKASGISGVSRASGISTYSRATDSEAPQLERSDFNSIMDEFLGSHSTTGKAARRVRRVAPQTGIEQLDEIRSGLGPARMKTKALVNGR